MDDDRHLSRLPPLLDVPYSFCMAQDRFYLTSDVAKRYCCLEIACGRCGHKIIADAQKIATMFPKPMSLEIIPYRLCCKACGKRSPRLTVVRKPKH